MGALIRCHMNGLMVSYNNFCVITDLKLVASGNINCTSLSQVYWPIYFGNTQLLLRQIASGSCLMDQLMQYGLRD